jgi:hypothetical protein
LIFWWLTSRNNSINIRKVWERFGDENLW